MLRRSDLESAGQWNAAVRSDFEDSRQSKVVVPDRLLSIIGGTDLPVLLPLFLQEARLPNGVIAHIYDLRHSEVAAWGVLGRDILLSRAVEAALLARGASPDASTIPAFLAWLSRAISNPWHMLLSAREAEERYHASRVAAVLKRQYHSNPTALSAYN